MRLRRRRTIRDPRLQPIKKRAIDAAVESLPRCSIADLGGAWAVDGGYTFYALEAHEVARAALLDEKVPDTVRRRARHYPHLELVELDFGSDGAPARVGRVDALIMFDVLLHQVAPDWDEVLEIYAPVAESFVIVNPQFVEGDTTVRLLGLGRERYLELVPPLPEHEGAFERLDELRDSHDIWQWGIVDDDLRSKMDDLGYRLDYFENGGRWRGQAAFENHAFVFRRE